jgi:protein-disulfide isomerase
MTEFVPSPDDPPVQTSSPKVKASQNPDLPPAWGPDPAKVYVVVFCDYRKAVCGRMTRAIRQIPQEWPGDVRVEFRHVTAPGDLAGEEAALAALAAHRQRKFWPMHECLMAHQELLDREGLDTCARDVGLDMKAFAKDRAAAKLRDRLRAEVTAAHRLGVERAPAYTVNGRLYLGWGSWELLRGGVDEERRTVNQMLAKGKKLADVEKERATQNVPRNALAAYTALVQHLHTGLVTKRKS